MNSLDLGDEFVPPRNHSEAIDYLQQILIRLGARVHHYVSELPCVGMYRSDTREIFLNASTARDALLALAHEGGHHVGYLVSPKKHSYQRERQAFVYGWHLLRAIKAPVWREEWRADERARRAAPDVDTSHVASR